MPVRKLSTLAPASHASFALDPISSVALSHHRFSPGAWPLVRPDLTLCILDLTFAHVAPTGASTLSLSASSISASRLMARTILVGGGLAGPSAAHTVLERVRSVLLLYKKTSHGGNSVKASSGINGAGAEYQHTLRIEASAQAFYTDTAASAGTDLARPVLITTPTANSASANAWLTDSPNVDLSVVSRLGGHTTLRTHRDKSGAPRWAIPALADEPDAGWKSWVGVVFEAIPVLGGYAADSSPPGLLARHRPDLLPFSTTTPRAHHPSPPLQPPSCAGRPRAGAGPFVDLARPSATKNSCLACAAQAGCFLTRFRIKGAGQLVRRECAVQDVEKEALCAWRPVLFSPLSIPFPFSFFVPFEKPSKILIKRSPGAAAFAEGTGIPLDNILSARKLRKGQGCIWDSVTHQITPPPNPSASRQSRRCRPRHDASARSLSSNPHTLIPDLWAAGEVIARTGTRRIGSRGCRVVVARDGGLWTGCGGCEGYEGGERVKMETKM
ncbi:hypothetical protein C8R45DRAFT_1214649 [Mycena sanguinolenta]|nr:hypothetical protein C8R45DRAFT_1214649 [Mycena sanguinolenta]